MQIVKSAVYAGIGAIGSRAITQMVLGSNNTSFIGYGANVITTLVLAWGGSKFLGRDAGNYIVVGGVLALIMRLFQDFTPWGQTLSLSGFGDSGISGLGAYFTSSYVQPPIYTGQGAQVRIPPAWQYVPPPPTPAGTTAAATTKAKAMGWASGSTYAPQGSTYRMAA